MSYNLYLKPRRAFIPRKQALDHLREREHYEIDETSGLAAYENEDTGVGFQFEFVAEETDSRAKGYPYLFQVNVFRPSYFILEAAKEIADFVRQFDCTVLEDDCVTAGPYNTDRLVERWSEANDRATRRVLEEYPEVRDGLLTLPRSELHRVWRWNYTRRRRQDELTVDSFVPKILLVVVNGELATATVWPDAISSILPKVDYLLIGRDEFLPSGSDTKDMVELPWDEATEILARHGTPSSENSVTLKYVDQPDDVSAFVRSFKATERKITGPGDIIDREIVEKARSDS